MGSTSSRTLGKHSTTIDVINHFRDSSLGAAQNSFEGKICVVTGGNSGLGLETVKAMTFGGASKVYLCCRSVSAGEEAVQREIAAPGVGNYQVADTSRVVVKQLDLNSLSSIKQFASEISSEERIDLLVLNAGIMALPTLQRNKYGWEQQIATNHFGHFYLTQLLLPKLKSQSTDSRIVVLSSMAHRRGHVDCADLHFNKGRAYDQWVAYGQSKAANILFTKSLTDQLKDTKVTATCLHPGVISTNLANHVLGGGVGGSTMRFFFETFYADKTIPQGASTTIYACLAPKEAVSGQYLDNCAVGVIDTEDARDVSGTFREQLWNLTTEQLTEALKTEGIEESSM